MPREWKGAKVQQSLQELVEAAIDGEHDFDDVWKRLDEALVANPGDVQARRLRIRLADGAGLRSEQLRDLQALCELDSNDREAALAFALGMHRWAFLLVGEAGEGGEPESDDDEDAPDATDLMRAAAVRRIAALAEANAADAEFMDLLFEAWDERSLWQPWTRLRLALGAAAAQPGDRRMRRHLATAWLGLVGQAPSVELSEGQVPMGFTADVYGELQDALIAERALAALDDSLRAGGNSAARLARRARLNVAVSRFAEAAADYAAAAADYRRQAQQESGDAERREELLGQAEEAAEMARRCAGGREALTAYQLAQMNEALAGLGSMFAERSDASAEARQFLAEMRAESERTRNELTNQLEKDAPAMMQQAREPDEQALAEIGALAERLAASIPGSVSFVAAEWREHDWARWAPELDPRLLQADARLRALGLERIGLVEHVDHGRRFGQPVLFGVWIHPLRDMLVSHVALRELELLDVESELDDGRQFATTTGRARNYMVGGPRVDTLHVDGDLPWDEVLALHRARVALALAQAPGSSASPFGGIADFLALQERQRVAKTAYRLKVGLSDFEALGIPGGPPEHFVPLVQAAARRWLAEAAEAFRRAQQGG